MLILSTIYLVLAGWYLLWWGYMYYLLKKEGLPKGDDNKDINIPTGRL